MLEYLDSARLIGPHTHTHRHRYKSHCCEKLAEQGDPLPRVTYLASKHFFLMHSFLFFTFHGTHWQESHKKQYQDNLLNLILAVCCQQCKYHNFYTPLSVSTFGNIELESAGWLHRKTRKKEQYIVRFQRTSGTITYQVVSDQRWLKLPVTGGGDTLKLP